MTDQEKINKINKVNDLMLLYGDSVLEKDDFEEFKKQMLKILLPSEDNK